MSHLTNDQFELLLRCKPPLELLEHAACCDECAQALAQRAMRLPMTAPPPGMIPGTLAKAQARAARESLGHYSLRVFAAMAAALILLFSGAFKFLSNLPEELPKARASITEFFDFDFTKEETPHASESQ